MIVLYLIVSLAGGVPQATLYATEAEACSQMTDGARIYAEESKGGKWKLAEGTCETVKGFRKK